MWLGEAEFSDLVADALDSLPGSIRSILENVEIVVEDWPSRAQLAGVGAGPRESLTGLYEGIPRTLRGSDYGLVAPDKITIFRGPILAMCSSRSDARREVGATIVHELAHHFGIDDDRLTELDAY